MKSNFWQLESDKNILTQHSQCLRFPRNCEANLFTQIKVKDLVFATFRRLLKWKLMSNPSQFWFPVPVCLLENNKWVVKKIRYFILKYCHNHYQIILPNYTQLCTSLISISTRLVLNFNFISTEKLAENCSFLNEIFWALFCSDFWVLSSLSRTTRRKRNYNGN